jgi:hypothetical protein
MENLKQQLIEEYPKKFTTNGSLSDIEDAFVERFVEITLEMKSMQMEILILKGKTQEEALLEVYGIEQVKE